MEQNLNTLLSTTINNISTISNIISGLNYGNYQFNKLYAKQLYIAEKNLSTILIELSSNTQTKLLSTITLSTSILKSNIEDLSKNVASTYLTINNPIGTGTFKLNNTFTVSETGDISANSYFFNDGTNITTLSTIAINTITGTYLNDKYLALTGGTINGNLNIDGVLNTTAQISALNYIHNDKPLFIGDKINTALYDKGSGISGEYLNKNNPAGSGTLTIDYINTIYSISANNFVLNNHELNTSGGLVKLNDNGKIPDELYDKGGGISGNYLSANNPIGTGTFNLNNTFTISEEGDISANSLQLVNNLSANEILYDNQDYPTIKAALDKLLFKSFAFSSFTMTPNTTSIYVGDKIDSLKFDWTYTGTYKEPTSQIFKLGGTQLTNDTSIRTYTYSNVISAASPTTFTFNLTVINNNTEAETISQNKTVAAVNYDLYFGTNDNSSFESLELNDLTIKRTVNGSINTSQTVKFETSTAQYIYFAIPINTYSSIKIKADGFDFDNYSWNCEKIKTISSTNFEITYNVYRFANTLQGSSECIFTFNK